MVNELIDRRSRRLTWRDSEEGGVLSLRRRSGVVSLTVDRLEESGVDEVGRRFDEVGRGRDVDGEIGVHGCWMEDGRSETVVVTRESVRGRVWRERA